MTNKSGIHPIDHLWHRQLSCGKYVICGNMLGSIKKTTIHCQSMLCYLYGMEVKGQIVQTTSVSNKIVRGFVSQEVHDIWAASRSDVLSKPWGIHHVDVSKESCHFIEPQRLIALLERQVPLAKASPNIKPACLARLQAGPDLVYAAELIDFCRELIQSDLDFGALLVGVKIPAPSEPEAQKFSPATMTFNQAADAIQKYREEQDQIDAELECLEVSIELKSIEYRSLRGELEKLNMRYSDLNLRRSACRDGMVAAARVMTAFSDDCPSTAPAFEHPTLLE